MVREVSSMLSSEEMAVNAALLDWAQEEVQEVGKLSSSSNSLRKAIIAEAAAAV